MEQRVAPRPIAPEVPARPSVPTAVDRFPWRRSSLRRRVTYLFAAFAIALGSSGCQGPVDPQVEYKPVLLPVKLTVGPDGVEITGDSHIVTPIGEFSIGARYALPHNGPDDIYVILRDRKRGRNGFDTVYRVRTGRSEFAAVTNGRTVIQVRDRRVTIDVTAGTVQSVEFRQLPPTTSEEDGGSTWWRAQVAKWNNGWNSSWYKPYAMTRAAYDDSTISKWLGVGFVWFLMRLALAVVLALVDTVLTVVFLVAQGAYMFFGPSGRNVVWGLSMLVMIVGLWLARA